MLELEKNALIPFKDVVKNFLGNTREQRIAPKLYRNYFRATKRSVVHMMADYIVGASSEIVRRLNTPGKAITVHFYLNYAYKQCELQ